MKNTLSHRYITRNTANNNNNNLLINNVYIFAVISTTLFLIRVKKGKCLSDVNPMSKLGRE